jgi:hypothetical protein
MLNFNKNNEIKMRLDVTDKIMISGHFDIFHYDSDLKEEQDSVIRITIRNNPNLNCKHLRSIRKKYKRKD